ncbi:MAG: guanylate kinase [Candidatus Poribacteria bacterium]|nr:guanylate kinase [Candidatus Poribacteria bacterium]
MLIIITGPSGVGKTTIIKALLETDPKMRYSVSLTTRERRHNEQDGVDYHFISKEEFKSKIENDELAEWSEVYGKYYGRLRKDLDELSRQFDVLVGIDVQGALKLKKTHPYGIFIFILPKSEIALEQQLRGRRTEDESSLSIRLSSAIKEIEKAGNFDYKVVNDIIDEAVKKVQAIMIAEKCRVKIENTN